MEQELIRQTKAHFSKLGLMYFLGSLIITGGQYLCIFIARAIHPSLLENYNYAMLIQMLPMYAVTMPLTALFIHFVPAGQPIPKKSMKVWQWLLAFMMCYGATYASNIVGNSITQLIGAIKGEAVQNEIFYVMRNLSPLTSIIITVILAPIMEEFLFRKLLIDRTIQYGEGVSIVFSGLLFGLFHGNLNQFAYAFVIGMFFGFIYAKTGKLHYSIFMHMGINFASSLTMILIKISGLDMIFDPSFDPFSLLWEAMVNFIPFFLLICHLLALFGITVTGIILWFFNLKKMTLYRTNLSVPNGMRFSTYILNVGMILFCVLWIVQIIIQLFQ